MSERWVDVSHEALIRGWPRLRRWIEEDRAGLRVHRRLTEAALEWDKMGRDHSALYRGARLSQAIEWRQGNEASLNDLERVFLDASAALERHEAETRERLRRRVIGGLSIALAIFAVLAGLALLQWRRAYREGQIALARQLAAQADLLRDRPEMLSRRLWLAAEAMRRLQAVGARSFEVDATLRRELALSPRHVARFPAPAEVTVDGIQLSPDGRYVIAGNYLEGAAWVREIATGKELVRIEPVGERELTVTSPGHEPVRIQIGGMGNTKIAGLSTDGKYMGTVNHDGSEDVVQVWEVVGGRELLRLRLELLGSSYYALSNDGRYLAASTSTYDSATSTHSEGITRVWDVKARREIPGSARGSVHGFSQDATLVVTSRGLWEIAGGLKERLAWDAETLTVAISADGKYVAIGISGKKDIEVWSTAIQQKADTLTTEVDEPFLRALMPGGRSVIIDGYDEIQERNVSTGAIVFRTPLPVRSAVVTPSGQKLIATVSLDGNAADVWELRPEGGPVIAVHHGGAVVAVGLTPQGRLTTIARNGEKLAVHAWDIETGQEEPELAAEIAGTGAGFAPDGLTFAVRGEGGVEVRKVGDPQPVTKLAYADPRAVAWSPDGRYLAASTERNARVWDLGSRHLVGQLALPGQPTALALARGGGSLAAVVGSGEMTRSAEVHTAMLWNVSSGEELKSFEPDEERSIRSDIHCALNTRYLVTQDLEILEMKSGASVSRLGLNETATDCLFSADGRYLAASSGEDRVQVWELEARKKAFQIPMGDRPVAFDQESRYLATISIDDTVRVWSLRQEDLIAEACRRLPRNLSEQEWDDYVENEAYHKTCPKLP